MTRSNLPELGSKEAFAFFALLMPVSIPFWLSGALVQETLLPGLPASALMAVAPALIGGYLSLRAGGTIALRAFLCQAGDCARMSTWEWGFALGIMPIVMLTSAGVQVASGTELPLPQWSGTQVIALSAIFLVAGLAEELGWTGHAARLLTSEWGVVGTAFIIGGVSVIWHAIPLTQADRDLVWLAWWAVGSLSRRMILTWLYLRGSRSVFGAALLHANSNLCWMLFPIMGSHYDPMVVGLVTLLFATTLIVVGHLRRPWMSV